MRKKAVATVLIVCLLATWATVALTSGSGDPVTLQVRVPQTGFEWTYSNGIFVQHLRSINATDAKGSVVPAEVLHVGTTATSGEVDEVSEEFLITTPDFRWVIAKVSNCAAASGDECHPSSSVSWKGEKTAWLFGASRFFGTEITLQDEEVSVDGQVDKTVNGFVLPGGDLRIRFRHEGSEYAAPYSAGGTTSYRKEITFGRETSTPPLHVASEYRGESFMASLREASARSDPPVLCHDWVSRGRIPLGAPLIGAPEKSDEYIAFPMAEALAQTPLSENNAWRVTDAFSGAFEASALTIAGVIVENIWRWEIELDAATAPPKKYEVTRRDSTLNGSSSYEVKEQSPENPDADIRSLPSINVALDQLVNYVSNATEYPLRALGISTQFGEDQRPLAATVSISMGEGAVSFHSVVVNAVNGDLLQVSLPKEQAALLLTGHERLCE